MSDAVVRDLRIAARGLRRNPDFAAVPSSRLPWHRRRVGGALYYLAFSSVLFDVTPGPETGGRGSRVHVVAMLACYVPRGAPRASTRSWRCGPKRHCASDNDLRTNKTRILIADDQRDVLEALRLS